MQRHEVFSVEFDQIMMRASKGELEIVGWAASDSFRFWYPHRPAPLSYMVDSDPALHGQTVLGFPVRPPSVLADADPRHTVLVVYSVRGTEIAQAIEAVGDFPIFWGLPQEVPKAESEKDAEFLISAFGTGDFLPLKPVGFPVEEHSIVRFDEAVKAMERELAEGPEIYQASPYWHGHAEIHKADLRQHGLGRFKYLINKAYYEFQVTDARDPLLQRAVRLWSEHMKLQPLLNVMETPERFSSPSAARLYAWFVGLIWEYTLAFDPLGRFAGLEEPLLGDPVRISRQGKYISQDLVHSYRELCSVVQHTHLSLDGGGSVAELGAGYGRLAYVFLKLSNVSYTLIDITPALAVAQFYLEELFPDTPIFRFQHFSNFDDIAEDFHAARIRFLTPNQLMLLPDGVFDHFNSVSNLHEMNRKQVKNLLEDARRTTRNSIYLKQWYRGIVNTGDGYRTSIEYAEFLKDWDITTNKPDLFNQAMVEMVALRR